MNRVSCAVRGAVCLFLLVLAGCGASPESVVEKYFNAVADNRIEDAVSYYSLENVKENDMTAAKGKLTMVVGGQYEAFQERGGLKSVKASLKSQKDNEAEVDVELMFKDNSNERNNVTLIRDGGWKMRL